MSSKRAAVLLLIVVLAALAVRLYWYIGPHTTDCFEYTQYAYEVGRGEFDINKEFFKSNRIAFIYPIGWMARLFGAQPFSFSAWGLLCSLGVILLGYAVATRLYDRESGLLTAVILAVIPIEIVYWSSILAESVLPLYWGLSIYLFHLGLTGDRGTAKPKIFLLLSGLVLGLAFYVRIHVPLVFLFMAAYVVVRRAWRWELLLVLVAFGMVALAGNSYYYLHTGDFFRRIHAARNHFAEFKNPGTLEIGFLKGLKPYYIIAMLLRTEFFGYVHWVTLPAVVYYLVRREKANLLPLTWMISLYFGLDFIMRNVFVVFTYPGYANVFTLPSVVLAVHLLRSRLGPVWTSTAASGSRVAVWLGIVLVAGSLAGGLAERQVLGLLKTLFDAAGRLQLYDAHYYRLSYLVLIGFCATLTVGVFLLAQGLGGRATTGARAAGHRFGLGAAIAVFLVLSSLVYSQVAVDQRRSMVAPYRSMADIINKDRRTVYVTDLRAPTALNFYFGFNSNYRYYRDRWERIPTEKSDAVVFRELPSMANEIEASSYVVVNRVPIARLREGKPAPYDVVPLPDYLDDPPADWVALYDSGDFALYQVQGE